MHTHRPRVSFVEGVQVKGGAGIGTHSERTDEDGCRRKTRDGRRKED